jgi:hypothetical protein
VRLWKKRAFEMLLKMRVADPDGAGLSFPDLHHKVTGGSRAVVMLALEFLEDLGLVERRLDEDKHRRWTALPDDLTNGDAPQPFVEPLPDLGWDIDLLGLLGPESSFAGANAGAHEAIGSGNSRNSAPQDSA